MVACGRCSLHTMPIILCQLLYSRWPSIKWRRSIFSLSKYTLVSSYCVYAETKPISSPQLVHNDDVTPRHKSSHRRDREKERHVTINEDEWVYRLFFNFILSHFSRFKSNMKTLMVETGELEPRWHIKMQLFFRLNQSECQINTREYCVVMRQSDFGWKTKI